MRTDNTALIGTPEQWAELSEKDRDRLRHFHEPTLIPRWKAMLQTTLMGGNDFDFPPWVVAKICQEIVDFHTRPLPRHVIHDETAVASVQMENTSNDAITDGIVDAIATEPKKKEVEDSVFRIRKPWPADMWGLPNSLVRTALFTSAKGNVGCYSSIPIAAPSTTRLIATGSRLTQTDLDVFLNILHLHREGRILEATPRQFLRAMLCGEGTREVDSLRASLRRLLECRIEISMWIAAAGKRVAWAGSLIRVPDLQQGDRLSCRGGHLLRITLDPALAEFIGEDVTWIRIKDRAALRKHRLAAGLFAMYSTHVNPRPMHIKDVAERLGVSVTNSDYEARLGLALDLLEAKKLILGSEIDSASELHVTPHLTPTKLTYLRKRGKAPVIAKTNNAPSKVRDAGLRCARWSSVAIRAARELAKHVGRVFYRAVRPASDSHVSK
jgi:hypothetical protein